MKEILKKKEYAIFIFIHPAQSNYTVHSIISAVNKMDLQWKFLLTLLSIRYLKSILLIVGWKSFLRCVATNIFCIYKGDTFDSN